MSDRLGCIYHILLQVKYLGVPWDHNSTLEEILQWWITNDQQSSWDKLILAVESCDKEVANLMRYSVEARFR